MLAQTRSVQGRLVAASVAAVLAAGQAAAQGDSGDSGEALRKAFTGAHTGMQDARMIGRIGLQLVEGDDARPVAPDRAFRSGDRFRFEITSNRTGWLYVLHASPRGKLQQLWPRGDKAQQIGAHEPYLVPPKPARFKFDEEIGRERFYVAIRSTPTPPALEALEAPAPPADRSGERATKPSTRITNFMVRDPFGEQGRSVLFDPGTEDADTYLYFSAAPGDPGTNAMVEFQLRHGK